MGPGASGPGHRVRSVGVARLEATAHAMAEADSVLLWDGADSGVRLRVPVVDCPAALRWWGTLWVRLPTPAWGAFTQHGWGKLPISPLADLNYPENTRISPWPPKCNEG